MLLYLGAWLGPYAADLARGGKDYYFSKVDPDQFAVVRLVLYLASFLLKWIMCHRDDHLKEEVCKKLLFHSCCYKDEEEQLPQQQPQQQHHQRGSSIRTSGIMAKFMFEASVNSTGAVDDEAYV